MNFKMYITQGPPEIYIFINFIKTQMVKLEELKKKTLLN